MSTQARAKCAAKFALHSFSWQAQGLWSAKVAETRNPLVTLHVSDRSRRRAVRILTSLEHFEGTLCECQIALAVVRCEFGCRSRNLFGTVRACQITLVVKRCEF